MRCWLTSMKGFFHNQVISVIGKSILLCCLLVVVFAGGIALEREIYRSNETLEVSKYTVTDERITEEIRMVVIADLHNHEFDSGNKMLLSHVEAQSPDMILFVGDAIMDEEEDIEVAKNLMQDLVEIAPVYFSMGNHEVHHQMNFPVSFEEIFQSCGVNVLEYEYEDIEINGQKLRLGGIYGYCVPENNIENKRYNPKHTSFLNNFMDTEQYTILLTHIPYAWLTLNGLEEWDIDLVLSGHTHGGLMKLGNMGSLYAPLQGFFQKETDGRYISEDGDRTLVVTRGLGNSTIIPRLNNVPEIMVVDLKGNN